MDDAGNILIRRYAKSNVYVKSTASSPNEETSIGAEIFRFIMSLANKPFFGRYKFYDTILITINFLALILQSLLSCCL